MLKVGSAPAAFPASKIDFKETAASIMNCKGSSSGACGDASCNRALLFFLNCRMVAAITGTKERPDYCENKNCPQAAAAKFRRSCPGQKSSE
jgi:hypothetical protein